MDASGDTRSSVYFFLKGSRPGRRNSHKEKSAVNQINLLVSRIKKDKQGFLSGHSSNDVIQETLKPVVVP
jgi:hypothetical protein